MTTNMAPNQPPFINWVLVSSTSPDCTYTDQWQELGKGKFSTNLMNDEVVLIKGPSASTLEGSLFSKCFGIRAGQENFAFIQLVAIWGWILDGKNAA